jgi:cyclophilin family peptidyl-prolyl cis-trans isomerase
MTPRRTRLVPLALVAFAVPLLVAACSSGSVPTIPPATPSPVATAGSAASAAPSAAADAYPAGCPTSQPAALPAGQTRTVTIKTDKGTIVVKVTANLSPIATGNFVALADCGYYDNVVFHRVVPKFVIQGGDGQYGRSPNVDPNLVGTGGPPYTIKDEPVTAKYHRGTVAMARTSQPDSVGSQFFIVLSDDAQTIGALSQANTYQIVGEVTSGMEAVDAIAAAADAEIPSHPIVMTDVSVATP